MLVRSCPGATRKLENEYVYTYSDTNIRFTGLQMHVKCTATHFIFNCVRSSSVTSYLIVFTYLNKNTLLPSHGTCPRYLTSGVTSYSFLIFDFIKEKCTTTESWDVSLVPDV